MIGSRWLAALAALTVSTAACGGNVVVDDNTTGGGTGGTPAGNPLVGTWSGTAGAPTVLIEQITLAADGTATATDTFGLIGAGTGTCTGALQITDMWTSTPTTFSVSGGTCTGQVACPNGTTIPCGAAETMPQTCTYTLSNGDATLVLTCPQGNGPITYTRQG